MADDIRAVPCGTCKKCCSSGEAIILKDDDGPEQYGIDNLGIDPHGNLVLRFKPNGDCILLGENGCTVWPNHPAVCRQYDCRLRYLELMAMNRQQRKAWAKSVTGTGNPKEVLKSYLDVG